MNDRDCENCIHKVNGACNVWECKFEPKRGMTDDAISRKEAISIASIATLSVNQVVAALEKLPPVNPQKPKSECEHDHEILKAYSDGASAVLDKVRAEIDEEYDKVHPYDILIAEGLERALDIIDKYIEEGKS